MRGTHFFVGSTEQGPDAVFRCREENCWQLSDRDKAAAFPIDRMVVTVVEQRKDDHRLVQDTYEKLSDRKVGQERERERE